MKKNDIIAQKLFETCKLSEFYLNLLKHEDESPMQLAHAYKQKLYEIVERYDRLLDANKQRQTLNLELELKPINKNTNLPLSKTSTPHKSTSALNTPLSGQMPISILTSSSSTNLPPNSSCSSSYASTPATTPGHSSARSTFGTYTRGSTRSIYSQAYQQHHYSNKQTQNFGYLYADTSEEENESDVEDDEYCSYGFKKKLDYETYSTVGKKRIELNHNSESDQEEDKFNEFDSDNMLSVQYNKNIEKSYSNLSKDSGVFGESYHSECSNHISGIGGKQNRTTSEHDQNESTEDRVSRQFQMTSGLF